MRWSKRLNWWGERYETKEGRYDRDAIETRALPVAPTQVQPHAEFVKCERKADAVDDGGNRQRSAGWAVKKQVGTDTGEKEDAVIQVVDMGSSEMEVEE